MMEVSATQEEAASLIIKVVSRRGRDITLLTGMPQVYMWVDSQFSLKINDNVSLSETGQKWHLFSFFHLLNTMVYKKTNIGYLLGGFLIFSFIYLIFYLLVA